MSTALLGPPAAATATGVSTDTPALRAKRATSWGHAIVGRVSTGPRPPTSNAVAHSTALVIGFSLADLKRVLAVRDRGDAPCLSVRALVGERLDGLTRRIEELLALRDDLRVLVDEWDRRLATTPRGARAHLLETLGARGVIEQSRRKRRASDASDLRRSDA